MRKEYGTKYVRCCGLAVGERGAQEQLGAPEIRDVKYRVILGPFRAIVLASSSSSCPQNHNTIRISAAKALSYRTLGLFSISQDYTMSDQFKELLDIPRDFLHDGTQFMNRFALSSSLHNDLLTSNADAQSVSITKFA